MIDVFSESWVNVRDFAKAEVEASRNALETVGLAPEQYDYHRGRIALAREIMALPQRQDRQ